MTLLHTERAKALHEFLRWCHAEDYVGTDDNMSDDCEDWIGTLDDQEVADLAVSTYRSGL